MSAARTRHDACGAARRLLVVANRLPVTIVRDGPGWALAPSAGGLAVGLRGPHERSGGEWVGWPGDPGDLDESARHELTTRLAEQRAVPVWLDADEVQRFYEGFSNEVLWPSFHYLIERVPPDAHDWEVYERVNERFAAIVAARYRPGDLVWVHDYQLMLVPRLLRQRVPQAAIGFFLHVPFPSPEIFRTLPRHERLLDGMLGADLVGFHTPAYVRNFAASALRSLGASVHVDRVQIDGREVRLGAFPMGVDVEKFATRAAAPEVTAEVAALRGAGEQSVMVGIDRLDHTKGIGRRLQAFELLLQRVPALRERVRLVQVAVPSREGIEAYQELRKQVEGQVGRLNGTFGTPRWVPVHYVFRSLEERDLLALYRAADVMLVTPIRDGMNLVAKEFVATRTDDDGVLVLSEFAGAAAELSDALLVNPFDVDRAADVYLAALTMPAPERRLRMQRLRRQVATRDVHAWAATFLDALAAASRDAGRGRRGFTPHHERSALMRRLTAARPLVLLLDYDGTLMPFADRPEEAAPDPGLLALLRALAARPDTAVHVVSGRSRDALDGFLGALPIALHAEHGFWTRPAGATEWTAQPLPPMDWREPALAILRQACAATPGTRLQEKTASLVWHYRLATPASATSQANELRLHLTELLSNAPVEILAVPDAIEIRPHGVNKGTVVASVLAGAPPGATVVAMGDDVTDEDLFAVLPPEAVAVHIGAGPSRAAVRLESPAAARELLAAVAGTPRPARHRRASMTTVAAHPFQFHTRLTLTKLTGRRAKDVAELVEHLRVVPLSVVFHHTHHFLVQHQYLSPEPPNDFAFWVTSVLQEDELGERLAAIDPVRFEHLGELRDRLVAVIDEFLRRPRELRPAPAGEEFHLKDAVSFVLPTGHTARTLAELGDGLRTAGAAAIAFHLFEARLRVGADDNDFSRWIEAELHAPDLAAAIRRLDPYSFTMEGLRTRLLELVEGARTGGAIA